MLTSLTIKNFKSFKDTTLKLSPFTLMIGANASGKSNALEIISLLRWFLNTQEYENNDFIKKLYCRGTKEMLWRDKECPFECKYCFEHVSSSESLEFTIVKTRDSVYAQDIIYKEKKHINTHVEQSDIKLLSFVVSEKMINSILNSKNKNKRDIRDFFKKNKNFELCKEKTIKEAMSIQILDLSPYRMRNYSDKANKVFNIDGYNLSSVIYNLCQNENNKKILLEYIQSLPEQNITDIGFIEVEERNEVMLKLEETFGSDKRFYDASVLSDGTLRVLAIVAFLLSAPEGRILIVEEIDNGIHPSRVKDFMEKVRLLVNERKLQLIMTSHNPALLDAIPNENLEDVVCCYRDKEEGDSRFIRLGDLYLYPDLVAQGSLGELVTQGIVERYVHDKRTPETIVEQRAAWLEDFFKAQEADHE